MILLFLYSLLFLQQNISLVPYTTFTTMDATRFAFADCIEFLSRKSDDRVERGDH